MVDNTIALGRQVVTVGGRRCHAGWGTILAVRHGTTAQGAGCTFNFVGGKGGSDKAAR